MRMRYWRKSSTLVEVWVFHSSIFHYSHSFTSSLRLGDVKLYKIEFEIWIILEKFQQFRGEVDMEKVGPVTQNWHVSIQVKQFLETNFCQFTFIDVKCEVDRTSTLHIYERYCDVVEKLDFCWQLIFELDKIPHLSISHWLDIHSLSRLVFAANKKMLSIIRMELYHWLLTRHVLPFNST